jgi:hypothetical protein
MHFEIHWHWCISHLEQKLQLFSSKLYFRELNSSLLNTHHLKIQLLKMLIPTQITTTYHHFLTITFLHHEECFCSHFPEANTRLDCTLLFHTGLCSSSRKTQLTVHFSSMLQLIVPTTGAAVSHTASTVLAALDCYVIQQHLFCIKYLTVFTFLLLS